MWRLVVVVTAIVVLGSACSEGLSAEEDLVQRLERFGETAYTVTYEIEVVTEGESALRRSVLYSEGSSVRADMETERGTLILIGTEDERSMCQDYLDDGPACFSYPAAGTWSASFALPTFQWAIQSPEDFDIGEAEDVTVAGRPAKCFDYDYDPNPAAVKELKICVSEDGLVLSGQAGDPDIDDSYWVRALAINIEPSVPDAIFERPYDLHPDNDGIRCGTVDSGC